MFCAKCGKQVPDQDSFCIYCGHALQKPPVSSGNAGVPATSPMREQTAGMPAGAPLQVKETEVRQSERVSRGGLDGKDALAIVLAAGSVIFIVVVFLIFVWLLPELYRNSSSRERPPDMTEASETAENSIVGYWVNEDLPGVVKFKSSGKVFLYSENASETSTYEYDEEEEKGTIFLETGDLSFTVSGDVIDIRDVGTFDRVDDKSFDYQKFLAENSSTDMTASAMPTETTAAKTDTSGKVTIGVSMPDENSFRWYQDGQNLKIELEDAGFAADLQYAGKDPEKQIAQIESMMAGGASVLVVAAVDGSALSDVLAEAKEMNIQVIAYDRLIYSTDAISYYVTFDNYMVGTIQGQYVIDALELDSSEDSYTIEFFGGAPDDPNAEIYFDGEYDTLKPYIDSGKLVVVSGQADFDSVATISWKTENAEARMDSLLSSYYSGGTKLDVVVCANDSTALGAEIALNNAGYEAGTDWPVITGQDCELINIQNMLDGKQAMSAFKDTRTLCSKTVEMVAAIVSGTEVPVNNTTLYDNGNGIVPAFLCDPVYADKNNYKEVLIDSGYYTESELG